MTTDTAAWVRANAWTQAMRKTYAEVPGFYTACACENGTSGWCQIGQCGDCPRGEPLRGAETVIVSRRHRGAPALFAEPYAHPSDISATGPKFERVALVWLADRVCAWTCPHSCHHVGHLTRDQLDLLDLVES